MSWLCINIILFNNVNISGNIEKLGNVYMHWYIVYTISDIVLNKRPLELKSKYVTLLLSNCISYINLTDDLVYFP